MIHELHRFQYYKNNVISGFLKSSWSKRVPNFWSKNYSLIVSTIKVIKSGNTHIQRDTLTHTHTIACTQRPDTHTHTFAKIKIKWSKSLCPNRKWKLMLFYLRRWNNIKVSAASLTVHNSNQRANTVDILYPAGHNSPLVAIIAKHPRSTSHRTHTHTHTHA